MNHKQYQSGFAAVLVIAVVLFVGIAGLVAWRFQLFNKVTGSVSDKANNSGLDNKAKNINLFLGVDADENFDSRVRLTAFFNDSVDSDNDSGCPKRVIGFQGKIDITYKSDNQAILSATQNKPVTKKSSEKKIRGTLCPGVITPPFDSIITLDKNWLNKADEQTIRFNDRDYKITQNKPAYTITWSKPENKAQTYFHPPDQLVFLSSFRSSSSSTCMSENELHKYAQSNGITLAKETYPNIENALNTFDPTIMEVDETSGSSNYYNPSLLVIINDHLKELYAKDKNEKVASEASRDECKPRVNSIIR